MLRVNSLTGMFDIGGDRLPVGMVGAAPSIYVAGSWRSVGHGLTLVGNSRATGQDSLGSFTQIALHWRAATTPWVTSFRCHDSGLLVFRQEFPGGLNGTAGGARDLDVPSTAFPAFDTSGWVRAGLRMVTFFGQNAARSTYSGPWPSAYRGGWLGGPVALYQGGRHTVGPAAVLSALSHFTTTEHGLVGSELHFGLQGLLHTVPPGHTTSFVLSPSGGSHHPMATASDNERGDAHEDVLPGEYAGEVASAFMRWGNVLLRHANGQRTAADATMGITHLGYSTTGAYHYNPCDCPNNTAGSHCARGDSVRLPGCRTYEDTMQAIDADASARGLPYAWWLIDSWWHAYDEKGHDQSPTQYFEDVPAQVGYVFPSGLHALYNVTRERMFTAHWSSQFAGNSPYATIDPANWICSDPASVPTLEHSPRSQGFSYVQQCIPISSKVWNHIFQADAGWGLRTIKIDHVFELFVGSDAGQPDCGHKDGSPCGPGERNATLAGSGALLQALESPTLVEAFVNGVGAAAAAQGLSILWCMPTCPHVTCVQSAFMHTLALALYMYVGMYMYMETTCAQVHEPTQRLDALSRLRGDDTRTR